VKTRYDRRGRIDINWCPGCGNFNILKALRETLHTLKIQQKNVVIVSGIGQAAKTPQYMQVHYFNGLHGRALPVATGVKAANPNLTVIAQGGDGDMYGEGGNHFIHTIRRNPDITNIVHNNMVYGLTKGQASPTSREGFVTPLQVEGVIAHPFQPLAIALVQGASFVARGLSNDIPELKKILAAAIRHKGYALVDILQPCVTFNRVNTARWFRENSYYLDDKYDPSNADQALQKIRDEKKMALGIIYRNPERPSFEDRIPAYHKSRRPLFRRRPAFGRIKKYLASG
jgi:2-oxoglutarate ferredoxin oxidoreductase subunit beta